MRKRMELSDMYGNPRTYGKANSLRVLVKRDGKEVLQEAWICYEDGGVIWEDVQRVYEDD